MIIFSFENKLYAKTVFIKIQKLGRYQYMFKVQGNRTRKKEYQVLILSFFFFSPQFTPVEKLPWELTVEITVELPTFYFGQSCQIHEVASFLLTEFHLQLPPSRLKFKY